jgi:hypothetical protein
MQQQQSPQDAAKQLKAIILQQSSAAFVFKAASNRAKVPFPFEEGEQADEQVEKEVPRWSSKNETQDLFAWWFDNACNGIRKGWATIERGKSGLIFRFTGTGDRYPSAGVRFEITGSIPQDLMRQVAQLK